MKRLVLGLGLALVLTGCGQPVKPERVEDEFGAAAAGLEYGTCQDCIPAIDKPRFESREQASEWLEDEDLVVGLDYQGEHKAYPIKILNWHEVVNDNPVVSYSALCGSAVGFRSEIRWGVSGRLKDGCLVLYNRESQELTGQREVPEWVPLQVLTWGEWKRVHPATVVLARPGVRDYEVNPYPELAKAAVMYEITAGGETKTYALETIKAETADDGVLTDVIGGNKIRLSYSQGEVVVENLRTKTRIIPLRMFAE